MKSRLFKFNKLIALVLIVTLFSFSLTACNDSKNSKVDSSNKSDSSQESKTSKSTADEDEEKDEEKVTKVANFDDIKYIQSVPGVCDFSMMNMDKKVFQPGDKTELWSLDLRSCNISTDDVTDRLDDLLNVSFDSKTIWPKKLPDGFNPQKIMELYKNPGLNIKELHKQGIDGRGVGIAIIDQRLLVDHEEYKDRLAYYEEYKGADEENASLHGCAVASIAVGKNVGVAPGADLYFFNNSLGDYSKTTNDFTYDYNYVAKDIKKIIKINKRLPDDRKIRIISISLGFSSKEKGYDKFQKAVAKAKENGIEVLYVDTLINKIGYMGIGRKPGTDGNNINDSCPGLFWMRDARKVTDNKVIYVPMDFRCTASPTGQSDYVVYTNGGMSWAVPYLAGLYALACQVKPDIDLASFFAVAHETGKVVDSTYDLDGKTCKFKLENVVSPVDMIAKLKSQK